MGIEKSPKGNQLSDLEKENMKLPPGLSKSQQDFYKQYTEQIKKIQSNDGTVYKLNQNRSHSDIESYKRRLKGLEAEKEYLEKSINILENLKYKIGDVVYHKDFGNGVICDILIEEQPFSLTSRSVNEKGTGYKVRFAEHDLIFASESELLPYNHATAVLFNKNK